MRHVARIIILYPGETSSDRIRNPANYSFSRLLTLLNETDDVPIYFLNWADRHEKYGNIEFIHFTTANFLKLLFKFLFSRDTLIISQLHHYRRYAMLLRRVLPQSRLLVRLGGVYNGRAYLQSDAFRRTVRRELRYLRNVDMVISTADGTPVDLFMEVVGVPKRRYRKWQNGFPHLPNAGNYTRGNQVVCIARLSPEKAVDYVIESFAMARPLLTERHRLVIVGDGPEMPKLKKLAEELGVAEDTMFEGESFNIERHLYSSKALITGLANNTVMEGIASGTPVITVDLGESHELYGQFPSVHVMPYPPGGYGRIQAQYRANLVRSTAEAIATVLNYAQPLLPSDGSPTLYSWKERLDSELELYESLFEDAAATT